MEGDVYLAVVGFGYGLGYVETETVAAVAAVAGWVYAVEAVEEFGDVFFGEVFAFV